MLTIGTRGSSLALAQAQWVRQHIQSGCPQAEITLKIIRTSADQDMETSIRSGAATGVFVKEIEEALIAGEIDLAVHSMKDLPTRIPEGVEIGAIPAREDPRDALIARSHCRNLDQLPPGAVIGTGSVRRQAQILALRPDLTARDIRGNVGTRLEKLDAGKYDAIILACAGLNRLGLQDRIDLRFETGQMIPAPGQGALALEVRKGDGGTAELISFLNDPDAATAVFAERAFLRRMGSGCNSPIAVHARVAGSLCTIDGMVATPDGSRMIRKSARCATAGAVEAADALAETILSTGGADILKSLP
ncbi:MAG: hydroxymethylbilane synthase [Acidobacteria bacterium]|nr:hydroxymethylbilane synthase [Acidobacteriota bacterium]